MNYLDTYLNKIADRGNIKLAQSIKKTAEDIGKEYLSSFSFTTHEIGLLFGNIQSGKTGHMFGVLCKATDLGFPVFLILTTDNNLLQKQTLDRVKSDLDGYCICGENDTRLFMDNTLIKPTIIVLKKNVRILKLWANTLKSTNFMIGNPLFIIDDEADAASLNTLVNRNRQSSINKYLDFIIDNAASSLYLQVTGTPQANFLQTRASGWHPYFTYYFQPGAAYLGGDFFFPEGTKPSCITYLDSLENPIRAVVVRHLIVSAQLLLSGKKVSNCLFHPSTRIADHNKLAKEVSRELEWCRENKNTEFKTVFTEQYESLTPSSSEKLPLADLFAKTSELLKPAASNILIMNGKHDVSSTEYEEGCNFIIGGNTLGRGVTFPCLQTLYYTRTSKKPQADTMWQHSRMFGYDRDPGLMMVFIYEFLYKLFADINATNNSIISQVQNGVENVKIYYPEGLTPTRQNVLDAKYTDTIVGGTNYYPLYPGNDSIEGISNLLSRFSDDTPYYQVNIRLLKEILSHITSSGNDFRINAIQSVLTTLLAEKPVTQGILIVRRNRDIAQGTGALLSPNDWQLGKSFTKEAVLTMYQVTGNKGWDNKPLWIPNIKLPDGIVYYDVFEKDNE